MDVCAIPSDDAVPGIQSLLAEQSSSSVSDAVLV